MNNKNISDITRLEELWGGDFGNRYLERNKNVGFNRGPFWGDILKKFSINNILEVGCNLGANLQWIASILPPQNVYGIDINLNALKALRESYPFVNSLWAPARELPFRDNWFDMVFTMGVLIHQPEESLLGVMDEVVRCSRKFILCAEYFAEDTQELPYHEQKGALFKRNYPKIYMANFPELVLMREGFLSKSEGWDDVSYWVFRKAG